MNTHPFDSLLTSTINCNLWQCNIEFAGMIQNIFFKSILIRIILRDCDSQPDYNDLSFDYKIKCFLFIFTVVNRGHVMCVRFLSSIGHQFIVRINPLR